MQTYHNLPLYIMDLGDESTGVEIVSLVDYPAIERNFIKFSKDTEVKFKVDEEKRVVFGPVLLPNKPIYRRDSDGYEYYVKFSKEAIERIAIKFFEDHNSTNVNLQHEVNVDGCVYYESFIKDSERGISPAGFEDIEDGAWFMACKINNNDVWDKIKDGTLRGFSIEGTLRMSESRKERVLDSLQDLLNYLK